MWGFTSKNKKALCDKRLVTPGWHVQQCMGRHWMWSAATVRSLLPMLLAHSLELSSYLQLLPKINNLNLKSSHFLLPAPSLVFLKVMVQQWSFIAFVSVANMNGSIQTIIIYYSQVLTILTRIIFTLSREHVTRWWIGVSGLCSRFSLLCNAALLKIFTNYAQIMLNYFKNSQNEEAIINRIDNCQVERASRSV